LKPNF
jgi:hypothetical protein